MSKLKEEFEADSEFMAFLKPLKCGNEFKITTLGVITSCRGKEGYLEQFTETLIANTYLTKLKLTESKSKNPTPDEIGSFVKILAMSKSLTGCHIEASSKFITRLIEDLGSNTTLKSLELSYFDIVLKETKTLSEWLKTNTTLVSLNLANSDMGSEGAIEIVKALQTNTTLKSLNLAGNDIDSNGTIEIAKALETYTTLKSLDLARNYIGSEGAKILAEWLKTNTILKSLNLAFNCIGSEGAKALAEWLKTNTTLKSLDLARNYIGLEGVITLSEWLKTNTILKSLNLASNCIGSEGANVLAEALKTNTTLKSLDLARNYIGLEGVITLSEWLKPNASLTELTLSYNNMKLKELSAIASSLTANKTLEYLNIDRNSFSTSNEAHRKTLDAYQKALNSNFYLRELIYDAKLDPLNTLPPLLARNKEVFDRAMTVIKKIGEGDNTTIEGVGSKAGFLCKYIQESSQGKFLEAFSPEKGLSYLSKVHTFICKYFFFISEVCTKPIDFGLPPDMWSYLLKNYLKLGDISWEYANKSPSQGAHLQVEEVDLAGGDGAPGSALNAEHC